MPVVSAAGNCGPPPFILKKRLYMLFTAELAGVFRISIVQIADEIFFGYAIKVLRSRKCKFHVLDSPLLRVDYECDGKHKKMSIDLRWLPGSFVSSCILVFFWRTE